MAVLNIPVKYTRGKRHSDGEVRLVTDKSFVTIWQLAKTLDDVLDTLNNAGCKVKPSWHTWGQLRNYTLSGLATKARILRKKGIPLKTLKRCQVKLQAKAEEAKLEKQKQIKELQTLAEALLQ
tara:strand:- start:84 stop:452 length:369 start_codon:yes stop_codon:yes gene_type:complete